VTVVLGVYHILTLVWSFVTEKVIKNTDDDFGEAASNNFTRFILIVGTILLIMFSVYYLIYRIGDTDILAHFSASHKEARV